MEPIQDSIEVAGPNRQVAVAPRLDFLRQTVAVARAVAEDGEDQELMELEWASGSAESVGLRALMGS